MDDRSVLVEDAGNPGILLLGLEGDSREFTSLLHRAWREGLSERDVSHIGLRLGPNLPYAQRSEILDSFHWLMRRVLRVPQKSAPRKPPSSAGRPLSDYFDPAIYGLGKITTREA